MRKLNVKNKIFIIIFALVIFAIIFILVRAISYANKKDSSYQIDNQSILFAEDTSIVDTSSGGKIEKKWDDNYYYVSDNNSLSVGKHPVIYNKGNDGVSVYGKVFQIFQNGNIEEKQVLESLDSKISSFYKLDDRMYLIVSDSIYTEDKTIYVSNYLIVYLDKQGNASLLNDAINVKTINPMILYFDDYVFDIANESLIVNDKTIDLKTVIGSTNEYVKVEKIEEEEKEKDLNEEKLVDSYNKLVNNFTQYANNHQYTASASNQINYNNNTVINYSGSNKPSSSTPVTPATNKSNIMKKISLRGAVSGTSSIDVSYVITDPEDKYQAVYLLVTGYINKTNTTQKIILDKYDTGVKLTGLEPNNEYTIALGYIEVVGNDGAENSLVDSIEDIINVRTSPIQYSFTVDKIAGGYVYFNYKMYEDFAFESADIGLYINDYEVGKVKVDYGKMISSNGFSSKIKLEEGNVYELRIENAIYNDQKIDVDINYKFTIST